jgi:predicted Zn-dependent peptidase
MKCKYSLAGNDVNIELNSEVFTLLNGLTLIVHSNPSASVVAVNLTYKVGAKDEPEDKTGIAHLCEHLMFGGTSVLPGSFLENMLNLGAIDINAVTSKDRTNYHQTILPGALDFVLFAESDRMSYFGENLTSDLLEQQRSVVINEKDERDGAPLGRLDERRCQATFPALHPYAHTVIGKKTHLESISVDEMKQWFRTYYVPTNAILTIAGCVNVSDVRDKVTSLFGGIPGGKPIMRPSIDYAPISIGKREILEARVSQSAIHLTWNLPPVSDDSAIEFKVLSTLLASGNDAYLHKKLIIESQVASQVSAYVEHGVLCSQFTISATVRDDVLLTELEKMMLIAIEQFKISGIDDDALEKVRALSLSDFIWGKENMTGIADMLGWFSFTHGDPDAYKRYFNILFSLTSNSFAALASRWLDEHRYTMHVVPFTQLATAAKCPVPLCTPEISAPGEINFHKAISSVLSNGIYLSHVQSKSVPGTLVRIILSRGAANNSLDKKGITALVCRLLLSDARSENTVKALERIGGTFSIESGLSSTVITLKTLSVSLSQSMSYLLEHLLNSNLAEDEFKRYKDKSIKDISTYLSSHDGIVNYILPGFIFPDGHPYKSYNYGRGTPESLSNITFDEVVEEREILFKTSGVKIIVVSDLNKEEVRDRIEDNISQWVLTVPSVTLVQDTISYKEQSPRALLIHKPGSIQSTIVAAKIIPPFMADTHAAFSIISKIFSSSFNSRLNMKLREELNWTYGVQGFTTSDTGLRMHAITTTVQQDKTLETIDEIKKSFNDLTTFYPIRDDELKSRVLSEQLRLSAISSDSRHILSYLTFIEQNNLQSDYWSGYANSLRELQPELLDNIIKSYLNPVSLCWIIVGDLYKIESDLRLILPEFIEIINHEDII